MKIGDTDDEALVRVHAAGVDWGVWHLITGLPYLTRLAFGLLAPKTSILGRDLAFPKPCPARSGVLARSTQPVSTLWMSAS